MQIRVLQAKFITSAPKISEAPQFGLSEVAFIGRSNVGKSSLINALCARSGLAKSSSTPGKTQLINFFELRLDIDNSPAGLIFVDLPGFGYARVSKDMKRQWDKSLDEFLRQRAELRAFIHLIDARHPGLNSDLEVGEYLKSIKRPDQKILNLYTKSDKLNQKEMGQIKRFDNKAVLVSASKKSGIELAWQKIWMAASGDGDEQ